MRRYPLLTPSPAFSRRAAPAVSVYATYRPQSIREGSLTTIIESERAFYVIEVYHSPFFGNGHIGCIMSLGMIATRRAHDCFTT